MKHSITIEVDDEGLQHKTDDYLAQCWHVAQANPADPYSAGPGELVETIGREIIRRWLSKVPAELYRHQGNSHYWDTLRKHGKWIEHVWTPNDQLPEALRET